MMSPPISASYMEGFKCFERLRLELGALTLVTGFNGGGKSTALQPLLLIAQTYRSGDRRNMSLNGALTKLGTAGDIAPANPNLKMIIQAEGQNGSIKFEPKLRAGDRVLPISALPDGPSQDVRLSAGLSTLSFLGTVRPGTADAFPIPEDLRFPDVGHDGRYAPYWYDQFVDDDVEEKRCHPESTAPVFRKQLDAWLGTLFPGAEANVQHVPALSLMNLQFRLSELGSWRRPSNIGFGLTYAFPILVALLAAERDQVVIIDSPESHLHPSAQSQMGRILGHFASSGLQIVVETHSDHLLNGVRLSVQARSLAADDLRIHFFKGPEGSEHGVVSTSVDARGEIYEWPDGFFDQGEKDLSKLAGWD